MCASRERQLEIVQTARAAALRANVRLHSNTKGATAAPAEGADATAVPSVALIEDSYSAESHHRHIKALCETTSQASARAHLPGQLHPC